MPSQTIIPLQRGSIVEGAKNSAFAFIYARGCQPYLETSSRYSQRATNMYLDARRFDGTICFPGGGVEAEDMIGGSFVEGLCKAVARECTEEIGLRGNPQHFRLMTSHFFKEANVVTHLLAYWTNYDHLKGIRHNATGAVANFDAESRGVSLASTEIFRRNGEINYEAGIYGAFQHPMPPTGREQLFSALTCLKLVSQEVLREIEQRFLPPEFNDRRRQFYEPIR